MKKVNKTWLYISVLTLITVIVWVSVSANESWRKSTIPTDVASMFTEFDPNLNLGILADLAKRQ